ncbi:2-succinyl-6-hydroxy-2,4-cyclohexadiene-1-carboxylate synthase [Thioalkalicoccus limnaeus]|uniref:Putative 2-succinyl-6-hydroxy-2,4-cyclohexadiene-1-carboxylate synthase n=1 Tax=Thioalkalicoccus limnaeus TaxID=120681 RepID=A0ABV4B9S6_9GAMM
MSNKEESGRGADPACADAGTSVVAVGGYRFHYRETGDRDAPPVLLLHGFLGGLDEFDALAARLGPRFRCVTLDLPGHGRTQVDGSVAAYRMAATARGVIGLLTVLGIESCPLVGYSMGGRLALYLAVRFPTRFDRLVLVSASAGLAVGRERRLRVASDERLAQVLEADGLDAFLSDWYRNPLFGTLSTHRDFAEILARRRRNDAQELARSLRHLGIGRQPSLWRYLKSLPMPCLLLVGAGDPKFVRINREMARSIPEVRLEVLAGCGHALHLEDPAACAERLARFLADAARSGRPPE